MQSDQPGNAFERLNAMGNPSTEPIRIVAATPDSVGGDSALPTEAMPDTRIASTRMGPIAVVEPPLVPIEPLPRRDWGPVFIGAFVALVVGAVIGYLVGHSASGEQNLSTTSPTSLTTLDTGITTTNAVAAQDQAAFDKRVDDILTLLVAQAQQNGHVVLPTPYPKLDQLLTLSAGTANTAATAATGAQQNVAQLTAQVTTLQQQVTDLQKQLTDSEENRIELQATLDTADATNAQATADKATIADLQGQVAAAKAKLDTANASLKSAQDDLTKTNAALAQLDVRPIDNLVGMDISKVRDLAKSSGWLLIEQPEVNPTAVPNTVLTQQPATGANMIKGSVLFVQVATLTSK